jgi:hypothetical protein
MADYQDTTMRYRWRGPLAGHSSDRRGTVSGAIRDDPRSATTPYAGLCVLMHTIWCLAQRSATRPSRR